MNTSYKYDMEGGIVEIPDTCQGKYYFMKILQPGDYSHRTELEIAKKLLIEPQDNIVKVLDISFQNSIHIKYELLNINRDYCQDYLTDIKKGLVQLHQLNVVYIDLKEDNIGYSEVDKKWKIFDFDCCGICFDQQQRWLREPFTGYLYRNINDMIDNLDLFLEKRFNNIYQTDKIKLQTIIKKKGLTKIDELSFYLMSKKFLFEITGETLSVSVPHTTTYLTSH